ncbi:hypothetical protein FIU97_14585 [Roseivivax sp. THAF40]|uniref:TipJ family phage tail tip protein n=1 Tax=Roseivivax sp. THAF40 TaxID=2587858 RepID=UPI001268E124|nr:hypothetical protein [Roseivivax sp. THAF40]QFT47806.1 hypothetical protein FIU97_14585 [Roseivivax sp. THAF40]
MLDDSAFFETLIQPSPLMAGRNEGAAPVGSTIEEIVIGAMGRSDVLPVVRAISGGKTWDVPVALWPMVKPKAGTTIEVYYPTPRGGLAASALMAVLSAQAGTIATGVANALGVTLTASQLSLATTAVTVVGALAVSALIPPPKQPEGPSFETQNQLTNAGNALGTDRVYPKLLGRHRMFPMKSAKGYTETVGDDIYVRERMTPGWASGGLIIESLMVGDTPIHELTNVELELLNFDKERTLAAYPELADLVIVEEEERHTPRRRLEAIGDRWTLRPRSATGTMTTTIATRTNRVVETFDVFFESRVRGQLQWTTDGTFEGLYASLLTGGPDFERTFTWPTYDDGLERDFRVEITNLTYTAEYQAEPIATAILPGGKAAVIVQSADVRYQDGFGIEGWRQGTEQMTLYADDVDETGYDVVLLGPNDPVVRRTAENTAAVSVDVTFKSGVYDGKDDSADVKSNSRTVFFEYKRASEPDTAYRKTSVDPITFSGKSQTPLRFSHDFKVPGQDQWDIRVTAQQGKDGDEPEDQSELHMTGIRSFQATDLRSHEGVAEIAVRAKGSDQLQGSLGNLNGVFQQLLPIYGAGLHTMFPDGLGAPAFQLDQGATTGTVAQRGDEVTIAARGIRVDETTEGLLFEAGATGTGFGLSFDAGGDLVAMAGNGSTTATGTSGVRCTLPRAALEGRTIDIYAAIRPQGTGRMVLYAIDTNTGLIAATSAAETTDGSSLEIGAWAGTDDAGAGTVAGSGVRVGVNASDFSGDMPHGIEIHTELPTDFEDADPKARRAWSEPIPVRHPAWMVNEALTGPHMTKPRDQSQIIIEELHAWADEEPWWTCDYIFDSDATLGEVLRLITASGRATLSQADMRYGVIRDGGAGPVRQVFTPRNSMPLQLTMQFSDELHGVRCEFISERNNWERDIVTVYKDGYDASNATEIERFVLDGTVLTKNDLKLGNIQRLARYFLAVVELRPGEYEIPTDFEHLVVRRGDKIRVTSDVILKGYGAGRVRSWTANGADVATITIDERLNLPTATPFRVSLRLINTAGDTVFLAAEATINDTPGNVWTITDGTFPVDIMRREALMYVDEVGQEDLDLLVKAIFPGENDSARIIAVDAAPEATQDGTPIPTYTPKITNPVDTFGPDKPVVQSVRSDDTTTLRLPDGALQARAAVILDSVPVSTADTFLRLRWSVDAGKSWVLGDARRPAATMLTGALDRGDSVILQVRSEDARGVTRGWVTAGTVTASDAAPFGMPPVVAFNANGDQVTDGNRQKPVIRLTWDIANRSAYRFTWRVTLVSTGEVVDAGRNVPGADGAVVLSEALLPQTAYTVEGGFTDVSNTAPTWAGPISVTTGAAAAVLADLGSDVTGAIDDAAQSAAGDKAAAEAAAAAAAQDADDAEGARDASILARDASEAAADISEAARDAAQAARDGAEDAEGVAIAKAGEASGSAGVAAGHAQTASDEADAAAGSASAASGSATVANTKAGEALASAGAAAEARDDADGFAASAAQSETVAARASARNTQSVDVANEESFIYWSANPLTAVHYNSGFAIVGGLAEFRDREAAAIRAHRAALPGHTFRTTVRARVKTDAPSPSSNTAMFSIAYKNDDLDSAGYDETRWNASTTVFRASDGIVEFVFDYTPSVNSAPFFCPMFSLARTNGTYNTSGAVAELLSLTVEDITESLRAEQQANASAQSAASAAASENEAGQDAAATQQDRVDAETARAGAEGARDVAVQAASDAEGSEANAAQSESIAVTARGEAESYARGNYAGKASFEDNTPGGWTQGVTDVPAPHPNGRLKALHSNDRDTYYYSDLGWYIENLNGRTFEIRGWVYNSSSRRAMAGMRGVRTDGSSWWPVVEVAPANEGQWREFSVRIGPGHLNTDTQRWVPFLQIAGFPPGDTFDCYWTDIQITDVTDLVRAEDEATASANSAATASAKATEAGQEADAAEQDRIDAQTARSGAEAAEGAAVSAKNDAEGAAADAALSEGVAVEAKNKSVFASHDPELTLGAESLAQAYRGTFPDAPLDEDSRLYLEDGTDPDVGGQDLVMVGRFDIGTRRQYAVDRGRRYRVRFRVFQEANASGVRIYAGVRCFNADGSNVNGNPPWNGGNFVNPNAYVAGSPTLPTGEWVELVGEFDGAQLRQDAFFMRPMILANYNNGNPGNILRMSYIGIEDITESYAAEQSASASADSAATASAKADDAGQEADAARQDRIDAETARAGAEAAKGTAVSAKDDAEGAAAAAAQSEVVAARASSRNSTTADLSNPETLLKWNDNPLTSPPYPSGIVYSGGTVEVSTIDALAPRSFLPAIPGHKYRSTVRARVITDAPTPSDNTHNISIALYNDDLNSAGYLDSQWLASSTPFTAADGIVEVTVDYAPTTSSPPFFSPMFSGTRTYRNYQASGAVIEILSIVTEDLTQSDAAAASAAAAGIAETNAVNAQSGAEGAEAAAVAARDVAVSVSSQGTGVLQSQFHDSGSSWNTGPTFIDNEKYATGRTLVFDRDNGANSGIVWQSNNASHGWTGPEFATAYRIEIEFTYIDGNASLGGAGILFDWVDDGLRRRDVDLIDMLPAGTELISGQTYLASTIVTRPDNFNPAQAQYSRLYLMINYSTGASPKHLRIHRTQVYPITATEAGVLTQASAIADLEGNASAGYLIKIGAGGAASLLELIAADGSAGTVSIAKLSADNIILDGTVDTGHLNAASFSSAGLAIFGSDVRSSNFVAGSQGWRITQAGDAEFNSIIDRSDLIEGSVSDGETVVDYIIAQQVDDNTDSNETAPLGPSSPDQVWFIGVKGDVREPRNGSGRTEVWIQRQLNSGGSWGLWRDITPLPSIDSTANNFEEQSDVLMYAPATSVDNIRFRCRVRLVGHTTATQTNVEDLILNVTGIRR